MATFLIIRHSNEDDRAIFTLRSTLCRAGSLQWSSAYGAVRLEIQPFQQHTDYRLCFLTQSHHTRTQVSLEDVPENRDNVVLQLKNYRLHEEKNKTSPSGSASSGMRPLVVAASEGKGGGEEVCVLGRPRKPVVLFLEVERSQRFTGIPSVTLQYDVEPLPEVDALLADPMEECRPCTQEELLESYCTSDFVAVGSIQQTRPAEDQGDLTLLEVAAEQLIHQTSPIFTRQRRQHPHLLGLIHAPAKCHVHRPPPGTGRGAAGSVPPHFLFTGRMRLGKAKLRCAPYFEDWLQISKFAECVYD
ncbi:hypothetical protein ACOMHN_056363 [Nucella lapillus]